MATVEIKDGVQPKVAYIFAAVANAAAALTSPSQVVVTACIDGVHSRNSRHYALEALDVRSKNFPSLDAKNKFAEALRRELGQEYLVLLEHLGLTNEHFHIQFKR
jgi:hypothetical protein